MFNPTKWNEIISKSKNIFRSFFIFGFYIEFELLWKKGWASQAISFSNYRLEKVGFLKCLRSLVSEHLWTVTMLKVPKDCLNLHGSIFVIFFDNFEKNQLEKFCFLSIWILETVCKHTQTRWQVFSLVKSKCLTQSIQMQLSQNQKVFSLFFATFTESA